MGLSATSSATQIMSTIRGQYQEQFAKLKAAYQETGSIAGAETAYASDDGNIKLSIRGMQMADGRQVVDVKFDAKGAEAATLQYALSGGRDPSTGLPAQVNEGYGETGMNGSDFAASAEDFDALADKFTGMTLRTQAQDDDETKSWTVGDKTFTSLEAYHAYNRVEQAAWDAAETIAGQTLLDTGKAPSADFTVKLQKAMTSAMRGEGSADLEEMLKGLPEHAIKTGMKALDKKNSDAEKLISFLQDYLTASKKAAEQRRVNVLV